MFTLFRRLAPEIRIQIWHDALPDLGPGVYYHKIGCWHPRRLTSADPDYDPSNGYHNLTFEFRHDLLDPVIVKVPLLFVSREARRVALAWIREHALEIRHGGEARDSAIVRPFKVERDVLYVPLNKWIDFIVEPVDRTFSPDLIGRNFSQGPAVKRIALPEALFFRENLSLSEILANYFGMDELMVVVGEQPNSSDERWELEHAPGGAFFWDVGNRTFNYRGGEFAGGESLYKALEGAIKDSVSDLSRTSSGSFVVRPVFAIEK